MTKTVVVTGAAGGIGRATCERLGAAGWNVVAADLDADKLGWADGTAVVAMPTDVADEDDNRALFDAAEQRFGAIDAVVLNAAVMGNGSIDDLSFDAFKSIVGVNLYGPVLGVKAALPALRRAGGGAIAITSSAFGLGGGADNWAYAATKHAIIGLVRSLSQEIAWEGIRINALCPGLTRGTGMTSMLEAYPQAIERLGAAVPMQRWADPDEMAAVLEFLVSPASSYVNGHALVADGGCLVGIGLGPPKSGPAPKVAQ